jgi:hypothetical protein
MAARVICISRTIGALGEEVGHHLSERLGFRYLDEEIVSRAAARENVDPGLVADAERRKSFAERLLNALATGGADAFVAPIPDDLVHGERYRDLIRATIEEAAAQGDVVIVAHAASYALAGRDGVLRVLLLASEATRAGRLGGDLDEARKEIERSDKSRADYLKRFYDVNEEEATHYDLVVNTDLLSAEQAAAVVAAAAEV